MTSLLQFSDVSNNFLTPDGYIPFSGYKGFVNVEDWSASWRKGMFRSTELTLVGLDWKQMDGTPYFGGIQTSYSLETRSDWHLELDYIDLKYKGVRDNTIGLNVISGVSNRFHQLGFQVTTGELGGERSTSIGPVFTLRMLKKLDLSYGGYLQNRQGLAQQHVLTMNYELSPTKSFGGRIVSQNSDLNAYLFYHNSGGKGTEFFFILGDPNAQRTVKSLQAKWVFSFG